MRLICFDIGATELKYSIVDEGKIILKDLTHTHAQDGQEKFVNKLIMLTEQLLKINDTLTPIDPIMGIGVSCAGSIDFNTGTILIPSDNAKEMGKINFKAIFKTHFNLPCVADNDVNCFAMAENSAGHGLIFDNFVVMTIGSGIGGGIIIHDDLWRGVNFNGGEIGRMLVRDGLKYEATASVNALLESCHQNGLNYPNALAIFNDYDRGYLPVIPIVEKFFENIAYGIANIAYILNPESVIIGGGISNRPTLSEEIKAALEKILHPDFYKTLDLRNAFFKNDGGMIGAYYNFKREIK